MKRIIVLIILLLIFAYVVPKKSAEQIPYGAQIQTIIKAVATPIGTFIWHVIGPQVSQFTNSLLDAAKQQLEQQLSGLIHNTINSAVPTVPSTHPDPRLQARG